MTVAAMLATAAAIAPQQPPEKLPQEPQRPTFRTEANFVRVDVYPTSGGKPVLDLRKEDFELLEDGRPQAIETFEHVRISGRRSPVGGRRSELDRSHATGGGESSQPHLRHLSRRAARHQRWRPEHRPGADSIPGSGARARRSRRRHDPLDVPSDVVLARKTQVIESGLRDASWGRRFTSDEDQR